MNGSTVFTLALVALAVGAGCGAGRQLVSPRTEYLLYRESRVAPTLEARLGAAQRYLERSPQGVYADQIRAWFGPQERAYLAKAHDSLPMLRAYLAAMPNGPHAEQVKQRSRELEDTVRSAADRELNRDARLASLKADLERAATQRKAFLEELGAWLATLSKLRPFGQPTSAIDPVVAGELALADPVTCQLDVCTKQLRARFAIPHGQGRLVPRDASFDVDLALGQGLVTEVRMGGRELFSRVGEALDLKPVSFSDPQSRAEAIGRALTLIDGALGVVFPEETCGRPAVSPVVLERACGGVRVIVTAAVDPGAADAIVFRADEPPPPPVARPRSVPPKAP